METKQKKNSYMHKRCNEKLENSSKVFTLIGLVLALFVVYVCLEHETKKVALKVLQTSNLDTSNEYTIAELFTKEVPKEVVQKEKVKQKQQQKLPDIVTVVKMAPDRMELPEVIKHDSKADAPLILDSINVVAVPTDFVEDVPIVLVEDAPVFPGCVGEPTALKKCLSKSIKKHVSRKFNADLGQEIGLSPGVKNIFVIFKINAKGDVTNIQARAPHPSLRKEAERVIGLLPKMKPGRQGNRAVGVQYSVPISFEVVE